MIELECVSSADLARDQCWWSIYSKSFPAQEREPAEVIIRGIDLRLALAARVRRDGRTVGIASAHFLTQPEVLFLVYLAIDPDERGRGLGAKLFEYAWNSAEEHRRQRGGRLRGIVWEVDPPGAEAAGSDRRIHFFQRMGAALLPRRYVQPPVNGVIVPMLLMFRPAANAPMPDDSGIGTIIKAMYSEKYGALNGIPRGILRRLLSL
jgi:GNAT superfamily N-acetyltransferase